MIELSFSFNLRAPKITLFSEYTDGLFIKYLHKNGDYNHRVKRFEDDDCLKVIPNKDQSTLYDFLTKAYPFIKSLDLKNGYIILDILIAYYNQCNYEFSIEELNLINKIGCAVTISCYESDKIAE